MGVHPGFDLFHDRHVVRLQAREAVAVYPDVVDVDVGAREPLPVYQVPLQAWLARHRHQLLLDRGDFSLDALGLVLQHKQLLELVAFAPHLLLAVAPR
eukprot:CAMPEP_0180131730 /NCGR_PEP_ID=MMETSP0986-20121125/8581_1 /TAXON_ID=697907 /ORGANISM="non described non described, Strain CCMP2293" /LENGTH=97 /DNA_ID=CAMNT_0022071637 /DNA_START=1079 /DNA_END=1372 /DNA_ORIENTATION=+